MHWFDTHAHIANQPLLGELDSYLAKATQASVVGMVAVGTDLASSRQCAQLAANYPNVWASVGIHPNESAKAGSEDWQQICELAAQPRVVALGETGLDKHWDDSPFELQQEYFQRHIDLSRSTGLPFIVHMRDCEEETVEQLRDNAKDGPLNGVMHSFTASSKTAELCQQWGMYISFAGMATYKNASEIRDVASEIRSDRILVETDCPYLTPHPYRGQRPNHPALVIHTGQCLATQRNVSFPEFARQTTENAYRLFKIQL